MCLELVSHVLKTVSSLYHTKYAQIFKVSAVLPKTSYFIINIIVCAFTNTVT